MVRYFHDQKGCVKMANYTNLMNSIWYGEVINCNISEIKENILLAKKEEDVALQLFLLK